VGQTKTEGKIGGEYRDIIRLGERVRIRGKKPRKSKTNNNGGKEREKGEKNAGEGSLASQRRSERGASGQTTRVRGAG